MLDTDKQNLENLKQQRVKILNEAFGAEEAAKFMEEFDMGNGDYTNDRDKILGNPTLEEIVTCFKEQRKQF